MLVFVPILLFSGMHHWECVAPYVFCFSLDYFVLVLFALAVLGLVSLVLCQTFAGKSISEMTYFVKPYLNQSKPDPLTERETYPILKACVVKNGKNCTSIKSTINRTFSAITPPWLAVSAVISSVMISADSTDLSVWL